MAIKIVTSSSKPDWTILRQKHSQQNRILSFSFSNAFQYKIGHICSSYLKYVMPFYSSCDSDSNDIQKIMWQKIDARCFDNKDRICWKEGAVFIASYIVSYLAYNKTFYIFLKCMKRRFFFTYQNSVNTGYSTRLGL